MWLKAPEKTCSYINQDKTDVLRCQERNNGFKSAFAPGHKVRSLKVMSESESELLMADVPFIGNVNGSLHLTATQSDHCNFIQSGVSRNKLEVNYQKPGEFKSESEVNFSALHSSGIFHF